MRSSDTPSVLFDLEDVDYRRAGTRVVEPYGGMTEAGLKALEQRHFREVLLAAVDASLERARQ